MKKRLMKLLAYIVLYLAGVIVFSNFSVLQRQQTVDSSVLTNPTLPVMCVDVNGNKVNRMFGYRQEMDATNMRGALIPMTTKRALTVSYKAYRNKVRSVSYEISAPDTGEVVENAKIGSFSEDGEYQTATFSLSEPILMNREYPIRFTISTDSGDVYYYARVIQRSDPVTDKYVQFVYDFYEGCTNQQGASELNSYLETDDTITNNSYTSVDIRCSLKQITWGNLKPQIYRKAVPTIREINGETCTITNDYLISAEGDGGQEVYHVWEYYRLRYYNSRMMLLNFNRKALQVFNGESSLSINANGVMLGVAERDVEYVSNNTASIVAFIQDGALWEFNSGAQRLSRVFSMRDVGSETDERNDNNDYEIRIIRVSESGGIDFVVGGYMSRGEHEGQQGVSVCHYNPETSTVSERAFIQYNRSAAQLSKDLDILCYVTTGDVGYFYLQRAIYRIELESGAADVVLDNINPDCLVSSTDNSMVAWMPEMQPDAASSITVMALETSSARNIPAAAGTYIKALGFLNDDFLYGIASQSDLKTGPSGDVTFAMSELRIEEFSGTLVKDYKHDGIYVTDVQMEPGLAQLTCATRDSEGNYQQTADDNIMNNLQSEKSAVTVYLYNSSRQGTIVTLKMPGSVTNLSPNVTDFSMRYLQNHPAGVVYQESDSYVLYYVYAGGRLQGIYTDPARAITEADEQVGVVINQEGQYIYERGNKQTKTELHNEDIPAAVLAGEINADMLDMQVGDDVTVMNLAGCTLDQVLYQLSQGRAVITKLADGSTAVIVGYDHYNTLLLNMQTGEHYYMGINDSTASMLEGGNIFVSYIERQATIKAD
ncbi:MAG: hypothetical protein Q4B09_01170 [Lachnospiraceae bacterium]|nr:hypothetical protein [Lachnospiraceae bacterium]